MKYPSGTNQELIEFCRGICAGGEFAAPSPKVILPEQKFLKVNGLEVIKMFKKLPDMVFSLCPAIRFILFFFLLSALMLSSISLSYAAEQIPVKRVHIIYGLNPNFPAHQLFTKGLQPVFKQSSDKFRVEYSFEYLDLGLGRADEHYQALLAGFLKQKYLLKPKRDLIIAHLTPANTFLVKYAEEILPGVPVIFTGDQPGMIPLKDIPTNFAGIVREGNPSPAVSLILQAQPETRKIYIVMGDSPQEREIRRSFPKDLASFSDKVEMIYLNHLPFPQMMETIKGISGPSVILYVSYFQDVARNNFVPAKVAGIISQAANVPTYGISAPYMGQGVVGGYQFSAEVVGERAAELGTKVLLGSRISDFPREQMAVTAEYRFDWRALKRFGIDERRLPRESKFEYRTPTFWESHKGYIIGGFIFALVETLLIFGLLINLKRRKKAEETIRESETLFRKLFEDHSAVKLIIDPDTGSLFDANEAAAKYYGWPRERLKAMKITDINTLPPEDVHKEMGKVIAKQRIYFEFRHRLADGSVRDVGVFSCSIEIKGKVFIHSIVHDITEHKRAEAALRESEASFQTVFERSTVGKSLTSPDGKLLRVNKAFADMLGYTIEEMQKINFTEITHPDDLAKSRECIRILLADEQPVYRIEKRYIHKSGNIVWANVGTTLLRDGQGVPLYFIASIADITERKQVEEALRESEEKYRTILENIEDGYYEVDIEGNFTFFNNSMCQILGYPKDDLMGMNNRRFTDKENQRKLFKTFNQVYTTGESAKAFDWQVIRKDGTKRFIEVSVSLQNNPSGQPIGFQGIAHDITERKRAEEALANSEEKFRKIFHANPDALNINRLEDGAYVLINPGFTRITGYTQEDFAENSSIKYSIWENIEDRKRLATGLRKDGEVTNLEAAFRTKGGNIRYGLLSASVIDLNGQPHMLSITRDITDIKRAEEKEKERQSLIRIAGEKAKLGGWSVNLEDNRVIWSDEVAAIHEMPAGYSPLLEQRISYYAPEWRERITKVFTDCAQKGIPYDEEVEIITAGGRRVWVRTIGEAVKNDAGKIIKIQGAFQDITDRKLTEKNLQVTLERLRKAIATTIQVMVSAVESRDPYTAGHQTRSADLARAIATEMGLAQEKIEGIRMAGIIHDIGKLSIPSEILTKPTRLTDLEFSLIKEHAQKGYELLKDVESPWPLAQIVYQHHERMDGSGYPRNLKGDEILMEARILAVADVVEAMASHRPYRPSLGLNSALAEIEKNKGTLYDTKAVDACLRLFREKGFQLEGE